MSTNRKRTSEEIKCEKGTSSKKQRTEEWAQNHLDEKVADTKFSDNYSLEKFQETIHLYASLSAIVYKNLDKFDLSKAGLKVFFEKTEFEDEQEKKDLKNVINTLVDKHHLHEYRIVTSNKQGIDEKKNNYYGVAFIHHKKPEVIIAHRGSMGMGSGDFLRSNCIGSGYDHPSLKDAGSFTKIIVESLEKEYKYNSNEISLIHTGHSLGGAHAQICVCEGKQGVAYSFDSFGIKEYLERKNLNDANSRSRIFNIFSLRNYVNTLRSHVGTMLRLNALHPKVEKTIQKYNSGIMQWISLLATSTYLGFSAINPLLLFGLVACFFERERKLHEICGIIKAIDPAGRKLVSGKDLSGQSIVLSENRQGNQLTPSLLSRDGMLAEFILKFRGRRLLREQSSSLPEHKHQSTASSLSPRDSVHPTGNLVPNRQSTDAVISRQQQDQHHVGALSSNVSFVSNAQSRSSQPTAVPFGLFKGQGKKRPYETGETKAEHPSKSSKYGK